MVHDIKANDPKNRLIGGLPKIGIRPTIDGRRRGVRESLEDQTMGQARAVADFLSANLKHSCGLPVECVIADTCIGGVAEAAHAAEKFAREGVGLSLTVTSCWCYGSEPWIWIPIFPRRSGVSTAPNVRVPYTWRRCWRLTARKDFRLSVFMGGMSRMQVIVRFPRMPRKNFSSSRGQGWLWPLCGANHICLWGSIHGDCGVDSRPVLV